MVVPPRRSTWDLIVWAWASDELRSHPLNDDPNPPTPGDGYFELRQTFMSGIEFGYDPDTDTITFAVRSVDGVELTPDEFLEELRRKAQG